MRALILFVVSFYSGLVLADGQDFISAMTGSSSTEDLEVVKVEEVESQFASSEVKKIQALIQEHTEQELVRLLDRVEKIHQQQDQIKTDQPVVLVLHGAEIRFFLRENYREHKELVDRTSRLKVFEMLEIRACNHWMSEEGVEKRDLPPFIKTVPVGSQEVLRLQQEGYFSF